MACPEPGCPEEMVGSEAALITGSWGFPSPGSGASRQPWISSCSGAAAVTGGPQESGKQLPTCIGRGDLGPWWI